MKLDFYLFTDEQEKNIRKILKGIESTLSGQTDTWASGGGFTHLAVQRTDKRWIVFHRVDSGITLSDPFETKEQVYEAFWDDNEKVCLLGWQSSEEFEDVQRHIRELKDPTTTTKTWY